MDEIKKGKVQEKMLDALLEYASACYVEDLAKLMDEAGKDESFALSPEFDKKMRNFIHKHERKEKLKRIGRKTISILPKVAMILLILCGSLAVLTTVSQAARVKVYNFFIDAQEKFTSIMLKDKAGDGGIKDANEIPADWHGAYIPTYIPKGFKVSGIDDLGAIKIISYADSGGETIMFNEYPIEDNNLQVDTEDAKMEDISINGEKGLSIEKKGNITLVWHNDENVFYLRAKIEKAELSKMAGSIKKQK